MQDGAVLDHSKKELACNLTNKVDHVHNQSDRYKNDIDKLWRILLDSQSTCNVIIENNLLTISRKREFKLRLQI